MEELHWAQPTCPCVPFLASILLLPRACCTHPGALQSLLPGQRRGSHTPHQQQHGHQAAHQLHDAQVVTSAQTGTLAEGAAPGLSLLPQIIVASHFIALPQPSR